MKRFTIVPSALTMIIVGFVLSLVLLPVMAVAQAIENPTPGLDLGSIFVDTATLAAFVIPTVAFIRGHLWTTLDGWASITVTFAVAVGLAVAGFYMHLLSVTTVSEAVSFGIAAGVVAIGGVKVSKKIAGTDAASALSAK